MILLRSRYFSANNILNTNVGSNIGFIRGRKYDTDLDRLGRMNTSQRELHKGLKDVRDELKKLNSISNMRKEERDPEFKRGFPFDQSNFQKEMRDIKKELQRRS